MTKAERELKRINRALYAAYGRGHMARVAERAGCSRQHVAYVLSGARESKRLIAVMREMLEALR